MTDPRHPDTQPIPFQYELACLGEECGEVVQIVGKTMRFGYESSSPADPHRTNLDLLHMELGDIMGAIDFAVERGLLDREKLETQRFVKRRKLLSLAPAAIQPVMAVQDFPPPNDGKAATVFILILATLLAAGIWIMSQFSATDPADQKKIDELKRINACYAAGKNACEPIATPAPKTEKTDLDAPIGDK